MTRIGDPIGSECDDDHRIEKYRFGEKNRSGATRAQVRLTRSGRAQRAYEMGAGIAANPHYPVSPFARCPDPFPPASLAIRDGPGTRRRAPERSGDGLVGPLSGAGLTWDALHHLVQASAEAAALPKRWTAFHMPDLVRLNSWESRRSVIKPSTDFLVNPTVLFRLVLQPPLMSRRSDVSVVR